MTRWNDGASAQPDALTDQELQTVTGGADLHGFAAAAPWVSPLAVCGFNPQPDPPARQIVIAN